MQIELTTPKHHDALIFFNGFDRTFQAIDYRFDLSMLEIGIRQNRIVDVLRYLQSGSKPDQYPTLNINGFVGSVAPALTLHTRWCYDTGGMVEWEYFWNWYPNKETKALILKNINNHLNPKSPHPLFKELIPYRYDRGIQIDPIPIYRLAGMVHADAVWLFTSEDKAQELKEADDAN